MPTSYETTLGVDAANSAATAFQIAVGGWAYGAIVGATDGDFIAVTLVAGQTYSFAALGVGAGALTDPVMQVFAPGGTTQLASDDNGLANGGARLTFTAASSGTHYVRVSGVAGAVGDYAVAASLGNLAELDATMAAAVLTGGVGWSNTALTFGFSDTADHGLANFSQFTDGQREATRTALMQFADVSGLTFTEVNFGGFTNDATLIYGNYSAADGMAAQSWGPDVPMLGNPSGDVFINTATPSNDPILPGSPAYFLLLQHIAQSLGLTASGTYPTGPLSYALDAAHTHDSQQYSVLSPFSALETGASGLIRDTLGIDDIAALQDLYGANSASRSGATVYGFGTNAGAVYDFAQNFDPMLTIWDAGGLDHLNTSQFSAAQTINLTAGAFSDIGGYLGNVSIAYGTVIENATGGRGADVIIGNSANNSLAGGASDDSLSGGDGNDTLKGGSGGDTLIGGAGNDSLIGDDAGPAPSAPVFDLVTTNGAAGAYVSATSVDLFPTASFSLEFIWQQTSLANEGYVATLGNLRIYRHADGNASLEFTDAYDETWLANVLPLALTDGAPHRISITYDDNNGQLCLYLDGACTYVHSLTIGTRNLAATGNVTFADHAAIGDIRLYSHALSASEAWETSWTPVADPVNTTGLMNYWAANGMGGLANLQIPFPGLIATGATGSLTVTMPLETSGNRMEGGTGDDTYVVRSSLDLVFEALNAGTDRIYAHVDFALGAGQHIETIYAATGSGGIALTGNEQSNKLYASADFADTLAGGFGNDVYYVYRTDTSLVEVTGHGTDTIFAYTNYTLAAGVSVEFLRSAGNAGRFLTGNALNNIFLSSLSYTDTLAGGAGNDRYDIYNSAALIIEAADQGTDTVYAFVNYSLGATASIEVIRAAGTAGRSLVGNALANTFYSSAGYADTLTGGAGNDVFHIRNSADQVIEISGQGTDTIYAYCDYILGPAALVEALRSAGAVGLNLTGNGYANQLYSNTAFADTLAGGGGNDSYYVHHSGTQVIELASGGSDTIFAYTDMTLATGSQVERITALGATGLALTGNEGANIFYSNALRADTMSGGLGNDTYYVLNQADQVIEATNAGTDRIFASVNYTLIANSHVEYLYATGPLGLWLTGNNLQNRIFGGAAGDVITGGAGRDVLTGGAGADVFVFGAVSDSVTGTYRDVIMDFRLGLDRLDLSQIDANTTVAGHQTLVFSHSTPTAYAVWVTVSGTRLFVRADVTGDSVADTEISLEGITSVSFLDFIL